MILNGSPPRSLGHEPGLGMTPFFLSSRVSEATEGSALDSERPQTEPPPPGMLRDRVAQGDRNESLPCREMTPLLPSSLTIYTSDLTIVPTPEVK